MEQGRICPELLAAQIAALELEARFALKKLGGEKSADHSARYSDFLMARQQIEILERKLMQSGLLP